MIERGKEKSGEGGDEETKHTGGMKCILKILRNIVSERELFIRINL
jgi:hypothetical protein